MQLHSKRADACAYAKPIAREDRLDRQLGRFRPELRNGVRTLALRHPRLADLAWSFPALLVALARPRARFSPEPAIARVIEGRPLREIAEAASAPFWLRKARPELIPPRIPMLPDGPEFRRQIANYLPRRPNDAPRWFEIISQTNAWAHEDFALWCARELTREPKSYLINRWRLISLWAWFSRAPGTCGYDMIAQRFAPGMAFKAAWAAAQDWYDSVTLFLEMGDEIVDDVWLRPGNSMGYEFVPLRTRGAMAEEAHAMKHCLRYFGGDVAQGRSRIWSVRKDGARAATAELSVDEENPWPQIRQIRMLENRSAPEEIWLATHTWLRSHELAEIKRACARWDSQRIDRTGWLSLWRPYWLAKRRLPVWLGLKPSWDSLNRLEWWGRRRRRRRRR